MYGPAQALRIDAVASKFNQALQSYAEAYRLEMDHFAAVLRGEEPAVGFADGVRALELAEAAGRSYATGRPVALSGGA